MRRTSLAALIALALPTAARADCLNPANRIVAENCLPGVPSSVWGSSDDPAIRAFTDDISYSTGATVVFRATAAASFTIQIYRMGYYGGSGARLIATLPVVSTQTQPACAFDPTTNLVDCGNWSPSASWTVPPDAVSGIYLARLVRADTGGSSHTVFIVRDDSGGSDILFQTPDTTWQAYNDFGGFSLYHGTPTRAFKVSYNRPVDSSELLQHEYPLVRWLEANGFNVSYFTGLDADRFGSLIPRHRVYMPAGHDEYWSGAQRANVEAARAAGVSLAFMSGDGITWKTRWEPSIDGSTTPYRTLVCYKETYSNRKVDPTPTWTGEWRDGRVVGPPEGGRPENALMGTLYVVDAKRDDPLIVDANAGRLRFWRNTLVAALGPGQTTSFADLLGYEWDVAPDDPSRPAGLIQLSSSTYAVPSMQYPDFTSGPGVVTHHLALYRHPSGALVFGAGTMQWGWGLDANHYGVSSKTTYPALQQATVNLLADMGAQPGSLQPGLVPASPSTDTTPPVSGFLTPVSGSSSTVGAVVQISGTASDVGGVVAGVEVSTDGGNSWRQAVGTSAWIYAWTPVAAATATLLSRAVDDSGLLETPGPGVTVYVSSAPPPPPLPRLFLDSFNLPDGLITNEYATYNPGNPASLLSSTWEVTSGSLFAASSQAWTGTPDNVTPNATSSNGTDSSVFRATLRRSDLGDVAFSFMLRTTRLVTTSSTPSTGSDGVYAVLRYQGAQTFYVVWINRRDGTLAIKKKLNGNYTTLGSGVYTFPVDTPQAVQLTTKNQPDGSVRLELLINGASLLVAVDPASAGPITSPGRLGIWGTNAEFHFDDVAVDALTPQPPPPPPPPPPPTTSYLLLDPFSRPDGLITNEYATYNPTDPAAVISSTWLVTSGSLFASSGTAWTGSPDNATPNATSSNGNGSAVFHAITKRTDFGDVSVTFSLDTLRLLTTASTPALSSDGISAVLRYQGAQSFYIVWLNRRDGTVIAKKKLNGVYTTLGSSVSPLTLNTSQAVQLAVRNQPDGSVKLDVTLNGQVLLSGVDATTPIATPGSVGIWSTNAEFRFDDFGVTSLSGSSSTVSGALPPPAPETAGPPTVGPNPWRADQHQGLPVMFRRLPSGSRVRLFTLSGREIRTLSEQLGSASWDLSNNSGERAATGLYFFAIDMPGQQSKSGVLAIIR